jgi:hypothetical protein
MAEYIGDHGGTSMLQAQKHVAKLPFRTILFYRGSR